jgi:hypothetical protein
VKHLVEWPLEGLKLDEVKVLMVEGRWNACGTSLGLCSIADFGNSDVESLGSSVRVLNTFVRL